MTQRMKKNRQIAYRDDSFPWKPCPHCGEIMQRRVHKGIEESPAKYLSRKNCSRECWLESLKPPPKNCDFCDKLLERKENESLPDYRVRRFCDKECSNRAMAKTAAKKRFKKLQRHKCAVYGCSNHVAENNRFLCEKCFSDHEQVWENAIGQVIEQSDLPRAKVERIIDEIRENLNKRILVFTWAEYKQDELEFYLMTPAQRREARGNYDRQARSER